jgi:phosphopantothenoylcysteine decarboxylase/phosphopantothenate--cysteine ligase
LVLSGKNILLIITGGIAAYKSLDVIRRLRDEGAKVRCVLTKAGAAFVTPLSVAALSGNKVYGDLFSLTDETEMGHIQLSRAADLLVIAPATADCLAKLANGLADDLASTLLLATDKAVLAAPAMNLRMWQHAATTANIASLEARGVGFVGPNEGEMACGEFGPGRMAEPAEIVAAIGRALGGAAPLSGRRALVTSGPTHEPIDPVRYIANRSSGRQGHAIAAALAGLGAETILVTGPTALPDPAGATVVHVETAEEMLAACEEALPVDVVVCAAAVADWRVASAATQKIKKGKGEPPTLKMVQNPDILQGLSMRQEGRPGLVIGFAAETEAVVEQARQKRLKKGCDWIVANDVSREWGTFGGADNSVHLIRADKDEAWPRMSKLEVARRLAEEIADSLAESTPQTEKAATP